MKHITTILTLQIFILTLSGCGYTADVSPSQNTELKKVTPSQNCKKSHNCEKKGYMQRALDEWLEEEWTPTVEKDEAIQKKYMEVKTIKKADKEEKVLIEKKDRDFTLQEYVDKASAYMKAHPADHENSHVKKVESLPVIGK